MTDRHTLFEDDLTRAIRERDEARAEARRQKAQYEEALAARDRAARAAVEDMADWRDEAERYREALERIAQAGEWPSGWSPSVPPWRTMAEIARQALGGSDD